MGIGDLPPPNTAEERSSEMRILVFPVREGVREVLVVPGKAARLAPILVRGTEKAAVKQEVAAAIDVVRRQRAEPPVPG